MPTLCPYPQLFCGSNSYAQFFLVDANMLKEFLAIAITFESKNNEKVDHLSFYYSSTYKSLDILTQSIDKFRLYSLMSWICTKGALNTSTDLWSYVLPHESPWADTARHMGIIFTGWVEVTNKQHNANCTISSFYSWSCGQGHPASGVKGNLRTNSFLLEREVLGFKKCAKATVVYYLRNK